jgi:AAHS family 4-hydroxybenzoate transporter-like MFS transporter
MVSAGGTDVEAAIDRASFGTYQIVIVAICCAVAMVDGFDTQAIAFVAPVIAASWGVPPADFGAIFGLGLLGGLFGALALGIAGDRWGRKIVLVLSILIFAVMSVATVWTSSTATLAICRILTGIGLGGAMPNILAITSEYSPKRHRATIVTLMFCGFPLGGMLGGAISAMLIPAYGWKSVFIVGGIAPLLLLPLVMIAVPESIRFLTVRQVATNRIAAILARIDRSRSFGAEDQFFIPETALAGLTVRHLFTERRASGTMLLWATFFMSLLLSYFLVNWMPTVLRQTGLTIESAVLATVMLNAGAIVGSIVLGRLIDRFGPYAVIWPSYAIGAIFVALIGSIGGSFATMLTVVFTAGFFSIGAQLSVVTLAATYYPTSLRATGIGWSMGVGRIGAMIGPVVGGLLITAGFAAPELFLAAAATSFLAGMGILAMGRVANRERSGRGAVVAPQA